MDANQIDPDLIPAFVPRQSVETHRDLFYDEIPRKKYMFSSPFIAWFFKTTSNYSCFENLKLFFLISI